MSQPPNHKQVHRHAATSALTVALLSGILLALIALIVILLSRNAEGGSVENSVLREADAAKPTRQAATERIVQTYQPGRRYQTIAQFRLDVRASNKDWGIVQDSYLHYLAELETLRHIESNDGTTLVLTEEFRQAGALACWSRIEGVRIELDTLGQTVLELAGMAMDLPMGWSAVTVVQANELLSDPTARQVLRRMSEDKDAQFRLFPDSMMGKSVRITYLNGTGVTHVEPLGGVTLNDEERAWIEAGCVIADAYVVPDPLSKPDSTWSVDGRDLIPIIDPSLRAFTSGELTIRRGADHGAGDQRSAELKIDGGTLQIHQADNATETVATWAPQGKMIFSFHDGIITNASLKGDFRMETHSVDHLIFESRFSSRPDYEVKYTCKVVP